MREFFQKLEMVTLGVLGVAAGLLIASGAGAWLPGFIDSYSTELGQFAVLIAVQPGLFFGAIRARNAARAKHDHSYNRNFEIALSAAGFSFSVFCGIYVPMLVASA